MRPSLSALLALLALASPLAAAAADPAADDARAREWFTDTKLVDQDGKEVRFYTDVLAPRRVVAISFMFTRCDGACPLLAQKLNRVRSELSTRFGEDVQFITISMDPEFDSPAELRKFAAKHGAAVAGWTFLTGSKADVDLVTTRLGSYAADPGSHSTGFIGGNVRTRHWMKIRPDEPAAAVAEKLRALADEGRAGPATVPASVR